VGEEDDPFVADELVELDGAIGGVSFEVRGDAAETERCGVGHGGKCCEVVWDVWGWDETMLSEREDNSICKKWGIAGRIPHFASSRHLQPDSSASSTMS
jgi:hypothetical protein